jgi:hypothetical protein
MFTSIEDEAAPAEPKKKTSAFGLSSFDDDAPRETAKDKKSTRLDSFENEKPLLAANIKEAPAQQTRPDLDDDAPLKRSRLKRPIYVFPRVNFSTLQRASRQARNARKSSRTQPALKDAFGFRGGREVSEIAMGPTVTRYEFGASAGIRV